MNKASKYLPQKPLLLNSIKNKLNSQIEKDINKKDYNAIKEILETKQEIIYNNTNDACQSLASIRDNKVKKILPPSDNNKKKNKR